MAERINILTKPGFPSLQFDVMNTLCFVLVLFTTQIIYTKEESSLDQNKTASLSTKSGGPPTKNQPPGIDFDKVELFKDYDELPSDPQDLKPASKQPEPPINSTQTDLTKNGPSKTTNTNTTSGKIYEDYDINDLQLDKYKLMVSPNRYKTINSRDVRFLNRNPSSVNNSDGSQIHIFQNETANNLNNPVSVPGSIVNINSSNSVIPWVISPACQHNDDSKYIFSAIFSKKPTVHLMTADNGTVPTNQTPKIVINNNRVTMSVGNTTLTNDGYVNKNSSNTTKSEVLTNTSNSTAAITNNNTTIPLMTNNNTIAVKNSDKLKIEEALLKGLTEFTMTIQNNTKPENYVTLSKVGNSFTISGQINTHGNDKEESKPSVLKQPPNATAQQSEQPTVKLIPNLQANVSIKTPTVTITAQGTKKIDTLPILLLKTGLQQTPIPGMTLNKTALTTALSKPQMIISNVLNSDLGERSFFPPELNQSIKRPTDKRTVSDVITQRETDIQSSDILYELFKNITITNVINEDLNRKLLNESLIHTQQNWQLINGNRDILNVLKDKN